MATPNPGIAKKLSEMKTELARLHAEKRKLFPPNLHPFAELDQFPSNATPEQIRQRNQLVAQIETLEEQIEKLEAELYTR
jgi:hypothetical protein